jgi:D-sedoheptulose 7-phosphate isomerase
MIKYLDTIDEQFTAHNETIKKVIEMDKTVLSHVADIIVYALRNGNKLILCGNGGSAADAQHIAAELTGRYKTERMSLPGIALTTDTSALTAIGNDYGYEYVFSRQLEGIGKSGDVLIGISTSGNSENIIKAFESAKRMGIKTVGLTGRDGGKMNDVADYNIIIPSDDTPRIQEMHILIGHTICQIIDNSF